MGRIFRIPQAIINGTGAHKELQNLQELRDKTSALFITDNLKVDDEVLKQMVGSLHSRGIAVCEFNELRERISHTVINSALAVARECKADLVVATGGRYAMHVGRLVAMLMTNGGSIEDYTDAGQIHTASESCVVIATTSSAGVAVSSCVCYINADTEKRLCFADPVLLPTIAILDPGLTNWLSPQEISQDGLISLGYAVEALGSSLATPVTDSCALESITAMVQWLPEAYSHSHKVEYREKLMYAQQLTAMASVNVMANMICKLAGQIEYKTYIPMGNAVAAILPCIVELFEQLIPEKMERLAAAIARTDQTLSPDETPVNASTAIRNIIRRLDMPLQLSFLGLEESQLEGLVDSLDERALFTNAPIPVDREAVLKLLKQAL